MQNAVGLVLLSVATSLTLGVVALVQCLSQSAWKRDRQSRLLQLAPINGEQNATLTAPRFRILPLHHVPEQAEEAEFRSGKKTRAPFFV